MTRRRTLRVDVELAERTYEAVARLVLARPHGGIGNGKCERCGKQPAVHPHHRHLRGQGGPDVPSNLAALCLACHRQVHADVARAVEDGWIVQAPHDHRAVPVRLHCGIVTLLDDWYGYDVLDWA